MALDDILKERTKKIEFIKEKGINPYPADATRTHTILDARNALDQEVSVVGRLRSLRPHGKIAFADLEDATEKIQLFFSQEFLPEEEFNLLEKLDLGDFLQISGEVFTTQAGEVTVRAKDLKLLTKSMLPLPSAWYGLEDTEERYRQRYIDLIINPEVRKVMDTRHQVIRLLRRFMEDNGFTEVETPTLQPIYGGATAKPFKTHHNALDIDLFLRISDELYLKRLIVGGYEKIFEICKDFRNEGIDRQHNPEFTMMEFYWAYANYEDLMKLSEEMVSSVVKAIHNGYTFTFENSELDFAPPFKRVKFRDLVLEHTGIDLDDANTEEKLLTSIKEKALKLDLEGVIGYGPLCDELFKTYARPKVIQPIFLVDYPYEMKPLAKKTTDAVPRSASFQLVVMGYEVINAYNELNDPAEQKARWEEQQQLGNAGLEEFQVVDEDYIRALEYGMPPTAGWGMGIDRFVSLLTDQHTLKDVIMFPTMRPENKGLVKNATKQDSGQARMTTTSPTENGIIRENAYKLLTEMISNKNLVKHGLAVEAIMRSLAQKFGEDPEEWGIVGLLHDADYELTDKDPAKHTVIMGEKLQKLGVSERIINAIKAHNDQIKPDRENMLEKSVYAADELSGLITAVALVRPDKKLSSVMLEAVMKKFPQKAFAAGAKREQIEVGAKELEMSLEDFTELSLKAMQGISDELGL